MWQTLKALKNVVETSSRITLFHVDRTNELQCKTRYVHEQGQQYRERVRVGTATHDRCEEQYETEQDWRGEREETGKI
jgi:hypothetical protein